MKFPTDVQNVLVVARNLNARDAVAVDLGIRRIGSSHAKPWNKNCEGWTISVPKATKQTKPPVDSEHRGEVKGLP